MRRRVCISFVSHTVVTITSFAFQKTINLTDLKSQCKHVDLITGNTIPYNIPSKFVFGIDRGDGKLGNAFMVFVTAQTSKTKYETIKEFNIYNGKDHVFEVDLPD